MTGITNVLDNMAELERKAFHKGYKEGQKEGIKLGKQRMVKSLVIVFNTLVSEIIEKEGLIDVK